MKPNQTTCELDESGGGGKKVQNKEKGENLAEQYRDT